MRVICNIYRNMIRESGGGECGSGRDGGGGGSEFEVIGDEGFEDE
jgi:hypothetical protein